MLNKITHQLARLKNDNSGASAIEYAIMAALLVVVIVFGVSLLGSGSSTTAGLGAAFSDISDTLEGI
jgi:Flp pilus assembly pilin Flp|tara:strand:- start:382 stop:582 length:201 start_codon:yes stop_codon:yes gene_type:complete